MNFEAYDLNDLSLPRDERDAALRWLRDNDPGHWDEQNGFLSSLDGQHVALQGSRAVATKAHLRRENVHPRARPGRRAAAPRVWLQVRGDDPYGDWKGGR